MLSLLLPCGFTTLSSRRFRYPQGCVRGTWYAHHHRRIMQSEVPSQWFITSSVSLGRLWASAARELLC
jgi:hypothetical protein